MHPLACLSRKTKVIRGGLQAVFYPLFCAGCGRKIDQDIFCANCASQLQNTPAQTISHIRSAADYRYPLNRAICSFKYNGQTWLAKELAAMMVKQFPLFYQDKRIDCLIPIPLFPARQRSRGFNQSELLAREIGNNFSLPVLTGTLLRTRNTDSQVRLARGNRLKNVAGAFLVRKPQDIQKKNCLLVDDVVTTGATLNACRHTLLAAGASQALGFTLARD